VEVQGDDPVPRRDRQKAGAGFHRIYQPGRRGAGRQSLRQRLVPAPPGGEDPDIGSDAASGGARRDEEHSRAKERIFSFRTASHAWDPKTQRPELWRVYNTRINKGESIRVFPLSNWTELDIWQYILAENIPIVPLYFAKMRPVVERAGTLIMRDDERMKLLPGEKVEEKLVRFRTLGCYPLTGAIESEADTLEAIVTEMFTARTSERQGRLIDTDEKASMEKKKKEGYF